jgi:hypothetical protein
MSKLQMSNGMTGVRTSIPSLYVCEFLMSCHLVVWKKKQLFYPVNLTQSVEYCIGFGSYSYLKEWKKIYLFFSTFFSSFSDLVGGTYKPDFSFVLLHNNLTNIFSLHFPYFSIHLYFPPKHTHTPTHNNLNYKSSF